LPATERRPTAGPVPATSDPAAAASSVECERPGGNVPRHWARDLV